MINRRQRNIITRMHKQEPRVMATSLLKEIIHEDVLKASSARGKANGRPGLPAETLTAVESELIYV